MPQRREEHCQVVADVKEPVHPVQVLEVSCFGSGTWSVVPLAYAGL